jgi:hypothetical protein
MLVAGCVFQEEKKEEKDDDDNGDNGDGDGNDLLNITELKHEPANPTEADDVLITVKIDADNDILSVTVFFCDESSGICTASEDMTLATGTENTYTYTLAAGTYTSGTNVGYHISVTDSVGSNDDGEGSYTVQ